jgi:hypothetical protein
MRRGGSHGEPSKTNKFILQLGKLGIFNMRPKARDIESKMRGVLITSGKYNVVLL